MNAELDAMSPWYNLMDVQFAYRKSPSEWWALPELDRAQMIAFQRLKGLRESQVSKVQRAVAEKESKNKSKSTNSSLEPFSEGLFPGI